MGKRDLDQRSEEDELVGLGVRLVLKLNLVVLGLVVRLLTRVRLDQSGGLLVARVVPKISKGLGFDCGDVDCSCRRRCINVEQ